MKKVVKKHNLIPQRDGWFRKGEEWGKKTNTMLFNRLNGHIKRYLKDQFTLPLDFSNKGKKFVRNACRWGSDMVRSTFISLLKFLGFNADEAASISGHKVSNDRINNIYRLGLHLF